MTDHSNTTTDDEADALLLSGCPLIDVRAEIEFTRGSIPGSVNLPILNTAERQQIGICYKQQGQAAAIALGHQRVNGALRTQRTAAWCEFKQRHPDAKLMCWRGGLRSNTAAQWMHDEGTPIEVIAGGYKRLRGRLIRAIEVAAAQQNLFVIGGRTGSGKTPLINALQGGIDLEGLAHHRGSSFGRRALAPPTQIDFENRLALKLLKTQYQRAEQALFVEDESRQIGAVSVPHPLYLAMKAAPLLVLEVPFEQRVEHILTEYCQSDLAEWQRIDQTAGFEQYAAYLLAALDRIRKRLGGGRHRQLRTIMQEALQRQQRTGSIEAHRVWIQSLLGDYYDPLYEYQLAQHAERVVFSGDREAVIEWCNAHRFSSG